MSESIHPPTNVCKIVIGREYTLYSSAWPLPPETRAGTDATGTDSWEI